MTRGEVVFGQLATSGGNGSEAPWLSEKAIEKFLVTIEEDAEGLVVLASEHGLDVSPSSTHGQVDPARVGARPARGEQRRSGRPSTLARRPQARRA